MAAIFDRTNVERIIFGTAASFDVGTGSFTLMGWGKWTDGTRNMYLAELHFRQRLAAH